MYLKLFLIIVALSKLNATTFQPLFPEQHKLYSYAFRTNVTTGTLAPTEDGSWWCVQGSILVQVYDDFERARIRLDGLKITTHSKHGESNALSEEAVDYLKTPWEVNSCFSSIHVYEEPVWVTNIKRALSFNFLVASDNKETQYTIQEPCLQGICLAVYSKSDSKLRKYYSTMQNGVLSTHALHCQSLATSISWFTTSYQPHHPNYVLSSEREYSIDQNEGLKDLEMRSSIQYRTENNLLAVNTDLSLTLDNSQPTSSPEKLNLTEKMFLYEYHNYSNPTNGIRDELQGELKNRTYKILLKIATVGIDADNIVRNASFIHSLDFIQLLTTMSQLEYPYLRQLFTDVLGTSYELETARNLFLEVLPYVRNEAAARLIRHLIIDQKLFKDVLDTSYELETARNLFLEVLPYVRNEAAARLIRHLIIDQKTKIEDATLVSLIRKLPFNLVDYNRPLLEDLEVFTKLGLDFPQEIRHAGILSFATLVGKAMDASFDQQYFDDIYDKYLRMYNYFPQYLDRLVWLQGLTNIGQSVAHYLTEIHTDVNKEPHERLWTALATLSIWKETALSNVLPILTNSTEHIQLRIIALHAFLSSPHTSRDFLNIHDYIKNCGNKHLMKFWYSTVKSLEKNRFYHRYKIASHYIPFVTNRLSNPGPQYWTTNNYIISQEPTLDVQGPTFQLLTVGGDSGLPELIMVEFSTGGERPFDAALYIIAEGVPPYVFKRLQSFNNTASISDELVNVLKNLKVPLVQSKPVHIDIVLKVHEKTVYATHLNRERLDKWNAEDLKNSIEDFVRFGSHINQQIVYYPIQMEKDFPTEIGTPVRLHSTIVSFTSIRGNLTAPSTEDISWINDLHIRYQGTSVTSLSTDGPLQKSEHTARIQQSLVVHLPIKVDFGFSLANKTLQLKWTNPSQSGGIAMHSRTQVEIETQDEIFVDTVKTKSNQDDDDSIFFDCENPMSGEEISDLLTSRSLLTTLHPSQLLLNCIKMITSPTPGSCGMIIPPRQLQTGNKFSIEVQVEDLIMDDRDFERMFRGRFGFDLKYFREAEGNLDSDNFLTVRGFTEIQNDGSNGNFSLQLYGLQPQDNWTICLQMNTKIPNGYFSNLPMSYSGNVNLNYSTSPDFACFSDEPLMKFKIDYKINMEDNLRRWIVDLYGNNVLSILEESTIAEELNIIKLYKKYNEAKNDEFLLPLIIDEQPSKSIVKINEKEIELKSGDGIRLPYNWNLVQMLKELGLYYECRIKESKVETFSGQSTLIPSEYTEVLAVGDCTNTSRFSIILSQDGGLTFYSGAETIEYNKPNGFSIKKLDNTSESDFRISPNGHDLRSTSLGIYVSHHNGVTTILLPLVYFDTICGLCSGQDYFT